MEQGPMQSLTSLHRPPHRVVLIGRWSLRRGEIYMICKNCPIIIEKSVCFWYYFPHVYGSTIYILNNIFSLHKNMHRHGGFGQCKNVMPGIGPQLIPL